MSGAGVRGGAGRAALACLLAGVAGLAAVLVIGAAGGTVLPAYLAAWLFVGALPLGALAVLLGLEVVGLGALPLAAGLRAQLVLLPLLALLALPLLLGWGHLFRPVQPRVGFAAGWYASPLVGLREAAFLLVWMLMALLAAQPGRSRGSAAGLLLVHVALVSVAATDWLGAAEPGLDSSLLGLVLLSMQAGTALSVALLLPAAGGALPRRPAGPPTGAVALLLGLLAVWAFLQFVQFLVVWSADLPGEVTWYLRRGTGLGAAAQWMALGVLGLAVLLLVPVWPGRGVAATTMVAALVLLLHMVEALWLVVPAFRGALTLSAGDVAALLGLGGPALGCLLLLRGRAAGAARLAAGGG